RKQALDRVNEINHYDTFIVMMIPKDISTYRIFRLVSEKKIGFCELMLGSLPIYKISAKEKRIGFFRRWMWKSPIILSVKLFFFLFQKVVHFPEPRMIFAGGKITEGRAHKNRMLELCKIVRSHALDFDIFREISSKPTLCSIEKPYIVFLDEYAPFHPDFIRTTGKSPIEPDNYYFKLNNFFDWLEKQTSYEVMIAAHPRSIKETQKKRFRGRAIFYGNTAELVRDCSLVLLHASTSVNFAVLFEKPMLFITSNEIDKTDLGRGIKSMASEFGTTPLNVDKKIDPGFFVFQEIEKAYYEYYKENYIISKDADERHIGYQIADQVRAFFQEKLRKEQKNELEVRSV
ncbi:MAG: hypothetical protein Q7J27_03255, partial [Syntrophales bacterium]|nr:hypothetical protein [Syntrophales bacterium]